MATNTSNGMEWYTTSYDKYQSNTTCHADHKHLQTFALPGFVVENQPPVNNNPTEGTNEDLISMVFKHLDRLGQTVDFTLDSSDSLYRCLSKEIYGKSDHYGMVIFKLAEWKKSKSSEQTQKDIANDQDPVNLLFAEFPNEDTQRSLEDIANSFNIPVYVLVHAFDGNVLWLPFYPEPKMSGNDTGYCPMYLTLLYLDGTFHRICPKLQKCRCEFTRPTCDGLIPFIETCLGHPDIGIHDEAKERLKDCLDKMSKGLVELKKRFRDVEDLSTMVTDALEQAADTLDKRRKIVNITVLSAQSISIATGIAGVVAFCLLTAGLATVPVIITMVSLGAAGSLTTGGAKIVQIVDDKSKRKEAQADLKRYRKFCEGFTDTVMFIDLQLAEMYKILRGSTQASSLPHFAANVKSSAASMAAVALRTAKSVPVIALMAIRTAASTADIAVAVLAPLALILDVGILVSAAIDTHRGSKSKLAKDLRHISNEIKIRKTVYYWMFSRYRTFLEGNVPQ